MRNHKLEKLSLIVFRIVIVEKFCIHQRRTFLDNSLTTASVNQYCIASHTLSHVRTGNRWFCGFIARVFGCAIVYNPRSCVAARETSVHRSQQLISPERCVTSLICLSRNRKKWRMCLFVRWVRICRRAISIVCVRQCIQLIFSCTTF